MLSLGLRSRLPVDPLDFADADARAGWVREKSMRVFTLEDPSNPMLQVDLFVENPIDFGEIWNRAEEMSIGPIRLKVASIPDLIRLKRMSGRSQDEADIEALQVIERGRKKVED